MKTPFPWGLDTLRIRRSLLSSTPATNCQLKMSEEPFRLDQFLKHQGLVGTGGEAKVRIQSGEVLVNGEPETRRRKKLASGDVIEIGGEKAIVP